MEAARKDIRLTYQDYIHLPGERRFELIEGDLHMTPSPAVLHQKIVMAIAFELMKYNEARQAGTVLTAPLDVYLSETTVVQPDILFITGARKAIITENCIQGPPDLVVEVLSSATSSHDRITKKSLYGKYGVREYWIVDPPAKTAEILNQGAQGLETTRVFNAAMSLETELLSGFRMALEKVFRGE
jgi:Uma2 family endonuclease